MKKLTLVLTTAILALGVSAFAQTAGQDMKATGSDIKGAAKSTGKATKKVAKTSAKKVKHGTHKAATAVKDKTQ